MTRKNDNCKNREYYTSGEHKKNADAAREKSAIAARIAKQQRIAEYNEKPNTCAQCGCSLPYDKKRNKFCSGSCSAIYHNARRNPISADVKRQIGESVKAFYANENEDARIARKLKRLASPPPSRKNPDIEFTCPVCNDTLMIPFTQRNRKTCGKRECVIHACVGVRSYQNGSRKPVYIFNKHQNKLIMLESSFELIVALHLDEIKVAWVRPSPLRWIDDDGKARLYYPDFYLPEYDLFLDPKNPYCMKLDARKMEIVSSFTRIIFGGVDHVINEVNNFCGLGGRI